MNSPNGKLLCLGIAGKKVSTRTAIFHICLQSFISSNKELPCFSRHLANKISLRQVVVAQLAERSLPTSEDQG